MIVSIHQPAYLPWLGYFDKISKADLFIHLDTVQFQKNSFQNRNKILTQQGPTWLTVPVLTKGQHFDIPLKELEIDCRSKWRKKHLTSIRMNYAKAPQFEIIFPKLESIYNSEWEKLSALCEHMMRQFVEILSIKTKIIIASDMPLIDSKKSDLVLDLCREAGADEYLSGALGRDYLDLESFAKAGIKVTFQEYEHPEYKQTYSGFVPAMGVVDLLMNAPDAHKFFSSGRE
jgi:hypothetical protein